MSMIEIYDQELVWIEPILVNWINIVQDFQPQHIAKYSFWYNERASVSFLSGAIWLSGGNAIEEFLSPKGTPTDRKGDKLNGRTDLALKFGNHCYAAEAKCDDWVDLSKEPNKWACKPRMGGAIDDAIETLAGDDEHRYSGALAIQFIGPYQKGLINLRTLDQFEDWLNNGSHGFDALAGAVTDPLGGYDDGLHYKNIYMAIKRVNR